MSNNMTKKVGFASLIMMASVFLSRVIGLFREMIIAYVGGAKGAVDAYQLAFIIPEILNHIIASGFLSVTFIPIFSYYLEQNREDEGWRVFSVILTGFGTALLCIILISFVFSDQLVKLIAPGIKDPELIAITIRMTRIIIPAQFFFFAGGMFMAVQFAKEKFAIPALAPLLYNLGIITGGLVLSPWLGMEGFSWGVLAGAFAGNFLIQYRGAKKVGMKFKIIFDFKHPELKKYIFLTLPLMIGLTMTFSTEFFFKFFGSYLPAGSIASLNYALRVMFILVGIFGQAAGVASFPFLARLAAQKKLQEMNKLLNHTLRRYISLVIPFSILIMVLRHEVIYILFQRGQFDADATRITSNILIFIMIGAFAFAAQTVVQRGYYATQNTLFPTIFGTIAVILSIPLYIYSMKKMGINGVALALSLSAIFQVLLLYVLWNRRSKNKESKEVYAFFTKIILISIPVGIFLEWIKNLLLITINNTTFLGCLSLCMIIGMLFLGIFMLMGYVLHIEEIVQGIDYFKKKILKRIKK
ncbi:putative lipid II flippase MurJ [Candidatus Magnetomoraceae bacterium gMMP-15]